MAEKPTKNYKKGNIEVAEWSNEYGKTFTVSKRYTKDGENKSTNSFKVSDLDTVISLLEKVSEEQAHVFEN